MISLEEIDQVVQSGPFEPTWDSLSHQVCPDWYRDANLGSLSTGVSTVYLLSVRNGIREICISKGILVMTIIESILETRPALATRISFLLFTADRLIRHLG